MTTHPEDWVLSPNQETIFNGDDPNTPYNIGDTWVDSSGNTYKCVESRIKTDSFILSDWYLVNPGLGTIIKNDDPDLGVIIYFQNLEKNPWNHGSNIQMFGDRINIRVGTDIVASWVGKDVNLGTWKKDTKAGDTASLSLYGGSAQLQLLVGETRDLLNISSGDIQLLAQGINLNSIDFMWNNIPVMTPVIITSSPNGDALNAWDINAYTIGELCVVSGFCNFKVAGGSITTFGLSNVKAKQRAYGIVTAYGSPCGKLYADKNGTSTMLSFDITSTGVNYNFNIMFPIE